MVVPLYVATMAILCKKTITRYSNLYYKLFRYISLFCVQPAYNKFMFLIIPDVKGLRW